MSFVWILVCHSWGQCRIFNLIRRFVWIFAELRKTDRRKTTVRTSYVKKGPWKFVIWIEVRFSCELRVLSTIMIFINLELRNLIQLSQWHSPWRSRDWIDVMKSYWSRHAVPMELNKEEESSIMGHVCERHFQESLEIPLWMSYTTNKSVRQPSKLLPLSVYKFVQNSFIDWL